MKNKLKYYIRYLMVFLSVCALIFFSACSNDNDEASEETAIPVNVHTVTSGTIEHSIRYMATVSGEREVRLFSRIPDRIIDIRTEEGDFVSTGEIVAVIENSTLKEAVQQAEAALRIARANFNNMEREYNRAKRLYDEEAISSQKFDQTETQFENAEGSLEQAKAALSQARENYNDSYIKAPFDGIINERFLEVGDMAAAGVPIFSIIQTENVKAAINVVDRDYNYIQEGQEVRLRVRANPGNVFTGSVTRKRPAFDPVSRLAKVEMLFPNEDGELYPGIFGEVEVIIDSKDNVPLVPVQAVLYRMEVDESLGRLIDEQLVRQPYVYVVEDNRAIRRDIEIGYETRKAAEVTSGLESGERIVVRGHNNLTDGTPVDIRNEVEYSLVGGDR